MHTGQILQFNWSLSKNETDLTSQTERVENKLRAVENGEAAVLVGFVLPIFEAVKVFGVPPWTDLSDLKQVHWNT